MVIFISLAHMVAFGLSSAFIVRCVFSPIPCCISLGLSVCVCVFVRCSKNTRRYFSNPNTTAILSMRIKVRATGMVGYSVCMYGCIIVHHRWKSNMAITIVIVVSASLWGESMERVNVVEFSFTAFFAAHFSSPPVHGTEIRNATLLHASACTAHTH